MSFALPIRASADQGGADAWKDLSKSRDISAGYGEFEAIKRRISIWFPSKSETSSTKRVVDNSGADGRKAILCVHEHFNPSNTARAKTPRTYPSVAASHNAGGCRIHVRFDGNGDARPSARFGSAGRHHPRRRDVDARPAHVRRLRLHLDAYARDRRIQLHSRARQRGAWRRNHDRCSIRRGNAGDHQRLERQAGRP